MIQNIPIRTPNLYGYSVWGFIAENLGTYRRMKHRFEPVTSSAFADDIVVALLGHANSLRD